MSDYETPWVDDHDPLCPPYLGAREGRAECAICKALEDARADERRIVAEWLWAHHVEQITAWIAYNTKRPS